jgi:hypothetical protein
MIIRIHLLIDVSDLYNQNKDKALQVKSSRPCLSNEEIGPGFNSTRMRILNDNFLAVTNTSGDMNSLFTSSEYASNFLTRSGEMRDYGNSGAIIDPRFVIDIVGESNSPINGN